MEYVEKNKLLNDAIIYATEHHAGQLRKGSIKPAIVHSLETMMILDHMEAEIDLLIAGILHDTVEDTTASIEEIEGLFGTKIADLVAHHTEDKSLSWYERKYNTIIELADAPIEVKMLVLADKISNMRDILADYRRIGDKVWEYFSAGKDKQAWYYNGVMEQLCELKNYEHTEVYYWEMVDIFDELFITYYLDKNGECIYQYCADGKCSYLQKGSYYWLAVEMHSSLDFSSMDEIDQALARLLEDRWTDRDNFCI